MSSVEIRGLNETRRAMIERMEALEGGPMLQAMRKATLIVMGDARRNAPVDTGRLRASIMPEVRQFDNVTEGVVGSNVTYAPYMELGTKPHWPPKGALAVWARRHGMPESAVRWSISKHGTSMKAFELFRTKGWRFLQRAYEDNIPRIQRLFDAAVTRIIGR